MHSLKSEEARTEFNRYVEHHVSVRRPIWLQLDIS
jgi:hypothetical protein